MFLSRYLLSMLRRVPAARDEVLAHGTKFLQAYIDQERADLQQSLLAEPSKDAESRREILKKLEKEFFPHIPSSVWETLVVPEMSPDGLNAIYGMTWVGLEPPPKYRGFLTSDNPFWYTKDNGLKPPDGEFLLPIMPSLALWGTWNPIRKEGYWVQSEMLVDEVNYRIVLQANEYVFYPGHKNWIEAIIKKVNKRQRKNDHRSFNL